MEQRPLASSRKISDVTWDVLMSAILTLFEIGQKERAVDLTLRLERDARARCETDDLIRVFEIKATLAQLNKDWGEVLATAREALAIVSSSDERCVYFRLDMARSLFAQHRFEEAVSTCISGCLTCLEGDVP